LALAELLGVRLVGGRGQDGDAGQQGKKGRETHDFLFKTSNLITF
jgi:hypothetical protein